MSPNHPNRSKTRRKDAPGISPTPDDLRALRARLDLSQAGLATLMANAAITTRAIQAYEAGERRCHPAIWRYMLAQAGELDLPE